MNISELINRFGLEATAAALGVEPKTALEVSRGTRSIRDYRIAKARKSLTGAAYSDEDLLALAQEALTGSALSDEQLVADAADAIARPFRQTWNPLVCDAHAEELREKLDIRVTALGDAFIRAMAPNTLVGYDVSLELYGRAAATRRAIVLAAAAIGARTV